MKVYELICQLWNMPWDLDVMIPCENGISDTHTVGSVRREKILHANDLADVVESEVVTLET